LDLIKRQDVINALRDKADAYTSPDAQMALKNFITTVMSLPSVNNAGIDRLINNSVETHGIAYVQMEGQPFEPVAVCKE